jgi:hypothetical protein
MQGMIPVSPRDVLRAEKAFQMTVKRGSSSVAALVLARVLQRRAQDRDDPEMMADAKEYENRALAAIKLHLAELPEKAEGKL